MTINEYSTRMGYTKNCDMAEYSNANLAYIMAGDIDKDTFCSEWKKHNLSKSHVVAEIANHAGIMELEKQQWQHTAEQEKEAKEQAKCDLEAAIETNRQLAEERDQLKAEVEKLAVALLKNYCDKDVRAVIGQDEEIALKCAYVIELSEDNRLYLAERLKRK